MQHVGAQPVSIRRFPDAGAWRLHHAPTHLSQRETGDPARDRFDDPHCADYRVRYFATTLRGAMLEVLDHFRPNEQMEAALGEVSGLEKLDILEQEPAGAVPENWLSKQRFALAELPEAATFIDVTDADTLAELGLRSQVQSVLQSDECRASLGLNARLDEGTIHLSGPIGRMVTQAVSRVVWEDPAGYTGISYTTRFDNSERCWAVFDERAILGFSKDHALSNLDNDHLTALDSVAKTYRLQLPPNWRLNGSTVP